MKFTELEIPGLIHVQPDVWGDERGFFIETHHAEKYAKGGIAKPFVQDNHSHSIKGVLRGLHFQRNTPQGKLVSVVRGDVWDVAVDIRRGSPAFGRCVALMLSGKNHEQLYVPEGCLHGFLVLSDVADVYYKCTTLYVPADDTGVRWDDPTLAVPWPLEGAAPKLSPKDGKLPLFSDIPESALPKFKTAV